jgi:hypothetical protein
MADRDPYRGEIDSTLRRVMAEMHAADHEGDAVSSKEARERVARLRAQRRTFRVRRSRLPKK